MKDDTGGDVGLKCLADEIEHPNEIGLELDG